MKIHKACKVESIASTDATRYSITEPFLSIKDGAARLVATNGKAMAILPVLLDEGDVQGYVSGAALKAARKTDKRCENITVFLNGVAKLADGATLPREGQAKDATFPNWEQVNPKDESAHTTTIAFDAKLLWELAQAMGTQGVILKIKDNAAPFIITPCGAGDFGEVKPACVNARGIIMPVRIS